MNNLLIIESREFKRIVELKKMLKKRFEITDLNLCSYYLNIAITRNRKNKTFYFFQKAYIKKILN